MTDASTQLDAESSHGAGTLLDDRALLRITGDDPRDFLQGLVTHDLHLLTPAAPLWSGLLSPQGKALFDFLLWDDGDAVLIDCEAAQAEALARRIALYRLRRAIEISPADGAVHWQEEGAIGVADPRLAELGRRWLDRAHGLSAAARWRSTRLALGITEGVTELGSGSTLWLECNARELGGVSFTKGCFIGQENTARMHHRDKVNRRLVVVPKDDARPDARSFYPELGLAVEHRRLDDLGAALRPAWLERALES